MRHPNGTFGLSSPLSSGEVYAASDDHRASVATSRSARTISSANDPVRIFGPPITRRPRPGPLRVHHASDLPAGASPPRASQNLSSQSWQDAPLLSASSPTGSPSTMSLPSQRLVEYATTDRGTVYYDTLSVRPRSPTISTVPASIANSTTEGILSSPAAGPQFGYSSYIDTMHVGESSSFSPQEQCQATSAGAIYEPLDLPPTESAQRRPSRAHLPGMSSARLGVLICHPTSACEHDIHHIYKRLKTEFSGCLRHDREVVDLVDRVLEAPVRSFEKVVYSNPYSTVNETPLTDYSRLERSANLSLWTRIGRKVKSEGRRAPGREAKAAMRLFGFNIDMVRVAEKKPAGLSSHTWDETPCGCLHADSTDTILPY